MGEIFICGAIEGSRADAIGTKASAINNALRRFAGIKPPRLVSKSMIIEIPLRLVTPYPDEKALDATLDLGKPGTLQIGFEFLRGRAFRDVRRSCIGWEAAMRFEDGPARVGTKIDIVDVQPAAGPKDARCFEHIMVAIPRFEMHEDDRAVDNIARGIGYSSKVISVDLPQLPVR